MSVFTRGPYGRLAVMLKYVILLKYRDYMYYYYYYHIIMAASIYRKAGFKYSIQLSEYLIKKFFIIIPF